MSEPAASCCCWPRCHGSYGYHRDELYYLRAGREPAFGKVNQQPLNPLLAHAANVLFGGSLVGLRLP